MRRWTAFLLWVTNLLPRKVIKEEMERSFRNTNMKSLNHSSYLRLQVLPEDYWDLDDKLSCLTDLSLGDLKAFIPELLSEVH
ncbi:hypothetical protein C5167_005048 [Papaver somniferum]|uniref:Uncharacterized protein n=1 Tax=Papaver somniferum TaxID=3469 RepID=A0A4Y7J9D9_PAPSO|nr:nardilysin-like [Papaver somniferum]RZC57753.1 hypothetical protein C5167_005048 [Papaver somniferum]